MLDHLVGCNQIPRGNADKIASHIFLLHGNLKVKMT